MRWLDKVLTVNSSPNVSGLTYLEVVNRVGKGSRVGVEIARHELRDKVFPEELVHVAVDIVHQVLVVYQETAPTARQRANQDAHSPPEGQRGVHRGTLKPIGPQRGTRVPIRMRQ
eukprot:3452575-Pyramimonas_sp.AAC.2